MQTIITPTDFSTVSLNAVDYAVDLACATGSNLTLFHVIPQLLSFSDVPPSVTNNDYMIESAEERIADLKEKIMLRAAGRITVHWEVKQGNVLQEIDRYCELIHPFAVVIGSESAGAAERFLAGGKTLGAVSQFPWPVIVVPPEKRFEGFRKIGLACDFQNVIDTVPVQEIKELVQQFHSEFHVLHVCGDLANLNDPGIIEESEWLQEILAGLDPNYHFLKGNDIEKRIAECALQHNLDLLIVIPKKHNWIRKIFRHSHSRSLVLFSKVPVLSLHE